MKIKTIKLLHDLRALFMSSLETTFLWDYLKYEEESKTSNNTKIIIFLLSITFVGYFLHEIF